MSGTSTPPPGDDVPARSPRDAGEATPRALVEGRDFSLDQATGGMVFTRAFLLQRGYCCDFGCRHCPYGDDGN